MTDLETLKQLVVFGEICYKHNKRDYAFYKYYTSNCLCCYSFKNEELKNYSNLKAIVILEFGLILSTLNLFRTFLDGGGG